MGNRRTWNWLELGREPQLIDIKTGVSSQGILAPFSPCPPPTVYGCKGGFLCVVHIVCKSPLQSELGPPESSKGILRESWRALSLTVAISIKLGQKVSAGLFAGFNSISLLVHQSLKVHCNSQHEAATSLWESGLGHDLSISSRKQQRFN